VHESSLVKIRERVEDRVEHFLASVGVERTLGKNLGEVLFGHIPSRRRAARRRRSDNVLHETNRIR